MTQLSTLGFHGVIDRVRSILAKDAAVTAATGSTLRVPTIRTYDYGGAPLGEWYDVTSVSVAFDEHGPATADIILPRGSDHLTLDAIMPGGIGAYIEIDCRDLGSDVDSDTIGIPDVWLGRLSTVTASSQGATCTVSAAGPHAWLDRITVARQARTVEPAGSIATRIVEEHPEGLVTMGPLVYRGPGGDADVGGGDLWGALVALANGRNEGFVLHTVPGDCRLLLNWSHPLGAEDRSGSVTLVEGVNCEWDTSYKLDWTASELLGIAESFEAGPGQVALSMTAPPQARIGKHAALTAALSSSVGRAIVEGGDTIIRPDIPTRAELERTLDAELRQMLVPPVYLQVTITDPSLWASLTGGVLVGCDIDDPLALFSDGAVGRILDRSYDVYPTLAMTASVELWRTADV